MPMLSVIAPEAVIAAAFNVPVNVGDADRTTLPVPVLLVTPVPPFATGKVPVTPVVRGSPVPLVSVTEVGVPRTGVTSVGLVLKTTLPEPVLVVTPVPPLATGSVPVTPVVKGRPVTLVITPEAGVPSAGVTSVGLVLRTLFPEPVDVVTPVPPLATASVPATVTTPVVAVEGVKPVVPKLIEVTAAVLGTAPQEGAPLVVATRTWPVVPAAVIAIAVEDDP